MKVVFSDRAMTSLLVETKEKITTETGGVFLGEFKDDVCYVVEAVDPGPNSIFTPTYFEYDVDYINHLINKLSRIYKKQLDLVGLWHRHPGSLDRFSNTDDGTNAKYAELSKNGAISALVNIDPEFRLTVYHVTVPLKYTKVEYSVADNKILEEVMELKSINDLKRQLADQNNGQDARKKSFFESFAPKDPDIFFGKALHEYLRKRTMADIRSYDPQNHIGELPVEKILDCLAEDLEAFEKKKISYNLEIAEDGLLHLYGNDKGKIPWCVAFGEDRDKIVFTYNELTYKYSKGLFSKVLSSYVKR